MTCEFYMMENAEEAERLELKTDSDVVKIQAQWAGLRPGMRVADVGCGSGKTSRSLHELVKPGGEVVGVDASEERIAHARAKYAADGLTFEQRNALGDLRELGEFDFIWVRFFLEYFRAEGFSLVSNLIKILKPGGIICLIDLDHNSYNHYGLSDRLQRNINNILSELESKRNFDPYAGRKLYSYLFDLGFEDINLNVSSHHLIFGDLDPVDSFNWEKKIEVATKKINYGFSDYEGGYDEFIREWKEYFSDKRRFTYTPAIWCRGRKPLDKHF